MRHDELRKTWQQGQIWEVRPDGVEIWTTVGDNGLAEPVWDEYHEYREAPWKRKEFTVHDPIEHAKACNQAFLSDTPIEIDGQMCRILEFRVQYMPYWMVVMRYLPVGVVAEEAQVQAG